MRARPRLTAQQRDWLTAACFKNAHELAEEALVVVATGAVPRGCFLALAAFEELVKALYCESSEDADNPRIFWFNFRSHPAKVELARRYFPSNGREVDSFGDLVDLRERCLYVDVFHDGRTLTPIGLGEAGGLTAAFVGGWALWIREEIRTQTRAAATRLQERTSENRT